MTTVLDLIEMLEHLGDDEIVELDGWCGRPITLTQASGLSDGVYVLHARREGEPRDVAVTEMSLDYSLALLSMDPPQEAAAHRVLHGMITDRGRAMYGQEIIRGVVMPAHGHLHEGDVRAARDVLRDWLAWGAS